MSTHADSEVEKLFIFVERLLGSDARKVFEALYEAGDELTEADIASKTGLKLNVVRWALNVMAEKGLVVYRKQKHPQKNKLIFYWRINYEGLPSIIKARKKAALERLKALLENEESSFYYVCPNDGTRYTFEEALEYEFTCPRCGSMLVPDTDKELRIELLKQYIRMLEEELKRDEAR
jgi:transcription initiation factor TFIIE subunit alpha